MPDAPGSVVRAWTASHCGITNFGASQFACWVRLLEKGVRVSPTRSERSSSSNLRRRGDQEFIFVVLILSQTRGEPGFQPVAKSELHEPTCRDGRSGTASVGFPGAARRRVRMANNWSRFAQTLRRMQHHAPSRSRYPPAAAKQPFQPPFGNHILGSHVGPTLSRPRPLSVGSPTPVPAPV